MKIIQPLPLWSQIQIDADKDMNAKSLTNLRRLTLEVDAEDGIYIKSKADHPSLYLTGTLDNTEYTTKINGGYYGQYLEIQPHEGGVYRLTASTLIGTPDKSKSIGNSIVRFSDGWFAGSLALGVLKDVGDNLTVGVVYHDSEVEKASNLTENSTNSTNWVDDWDIGTLETVTENGILTRIKLQFDVYQTNTTEPSYYRFLEDGVELGSWSYTNTTYETKSYEFYTKKTSAAYKTQFKTYASSYTIYVKNRYLYFAKHYLGIKAGE